MILGLLASVLLATAPAATRVEPLFVAVVDPGHGGDKDGALGPEGLKEKDVALAIARRVAERLREAGGAVFLTREGDSPLELPERAALANAAGADLFISIHLNAMPTPRARARSHGVETYFLSADATDASAKAVAARENADRIAGTAPDPANPVSGILNDLESVEALAESSRLAHALHGRLLARTGAADRGVKQAPFLVLAGARMAAVLLEVGFVTHPEEARRLTDPAYQDLIAAGVAEGVVAFRDGPVHASR